MLSNSCPKLRVDIDGYLDELDEDDDKSTVYASFSCAMYLFLNVPINEKHYEPGNCLLKSLLLRFCLM